MKPITIFYSYSHKDETLREQLENHLSLLRRKGFISNWSDRQISAGTEWKDQIDRRIELAEIILLLTSGDFLASDYCYDIELTRAMERHEQSEARVIPVILRPCDWSDAPFGKLQALPKDGKPITTWANVDEAWLNVAQGIRLACQEIEERQVPGIKIFCEKRPPSGLLVWPRCGVWLPNAPEASWDLRFGATTVDLSWGQSRMILLQPGVPYSIAAYTDVPFGGSVAVARVKCTVEEHEVVQYSYRITMQPGSSDEEMFQGQLLQVVFI
jgi:hypothetical protein